MEQIDQTMKPTWDIALRIWWWIMWRAFLLALFGGFVLGILAGIILGLIGMNPITIRLISSILGFIFGIAVNIYYIKEIIGKRIKNFKLKLVNQE